MSSDRSPAPAPAPLDIDNESATRRFVSQIAIPMSVDDGDYLTLARVTPGKGRKEIQLGRLDKGDEQTIWAFIQDQTRRHGHGRYRARYYGAHGRGKRSVTFNLPDPRAGREVPKRRATSPVPPPPARPRAVEPKGERSAAADRAASDDLVGKMSATIRDLNTKIGDLEAERDHREGALADMQARNEELESALGLAEERVRSIEAANRKLDEEATRLGDIAAQRDQLQSQLKELAGDLKKEARARKAAEQLVAEERRGRATAKRQLAGENAKLRQENTSLGVQIASMTRELGQLRKRAPHPAPVQPDLRQEVSRLTTERDQLRADLARVQSQLAADTRSQAKSLRKMRAEHATQLARIDDLVQANAHLHKRVKKAEGRAGDLNDIIIENLIQPDDE